MPALRALASAALLLSTVPGAPATAAEGAWAPTLAATSAVDNLSVFPDGTAYASVGVVTFSDGTLLPDPVPEQRGGSAGFFKSTDFGQTWVAVPPPPVPMTGTANLWVRFATPEIGYVTASFGRYIPKDPTGRIDRALCRRLSPMFRTADGGQTWQQLCDPHLPTGEPIVHTPSPLAPAPDGRTVFLSSSETSGVTEHDCPVARGAVWTSNDAGETWRRGYLPRYYEPHWNIRAYDSRTALVMAHRMEYDEQCYGLGNRTAVFLTNDSGRTWRRIYECAAHPLCTTAAFVTRTKILVGRNDGSTAVTTDAGRTWRAGQRLHDRANAELERLDPERRYWHWVQSFDFVDAKVGYASTRGAGTWRTTDGGRTWRQERSHECHYYPSGIGENAAATADRAVTGGPAWFSTRVPSAAPAGPCTPDSGQRMAGPVVVAQVGPHAVLADGTLRTGG